MIAVIIALAVGMVVGFWGREQSRLFSLLDVLTMWIIRLLLFFLGTDIGSDGELLAQIPLLGAKGLVLAVASVVGSVLAARVMVGRLGAVSADYGKEIKTGGEKLEDVPGGRRKALGGSLAAVAAFALGIGAGILAPGFGDLSFNPTTVILYILMFFVGMATGADPTALATIRKHGLRMTLLPLAVVIGTAFGCLGVALVWSEVSIRESLVVGAGFGYYSLSSIVIKEIAGGEWAAVALLSNVFREIITLLAAPLFVWLGGPAGPAAAGGATSMDTTLAVTVQCSGRAWAVPALFSGVILTVLVPFAVTFILTF